MLGSGGAFAVLADDRMIPMVDVEGEVLLVWFRAGLGTRRDYQICCFSVIVVRAW